MGTIHLYLDETGSFKENVRSAISGVWTLKPMSDAEATAFLEEATGGPLNGPFHGMDYAGDKTALYRRALDGMKRRGWRPLICEHATQRVIGDNATTHAHVFAEAVNLFARQQAPGQVDGLHLEILAATRQAPVDNSGKLFRKQTKEEYLVPVEARIEVERLRTPRAAREAPWTHHIDLAVADESRKLQVADLVSFAWNRLANLPPGLREEWSAFLREHTFTAFQLEDNDQFESYLAHGEYGPALLLLMSTIGEPDNLPATVRRQRDRLIEELAAADAETRDLALGAGLGRLKAEVDIQRRLDQADRWLRIWSRVILGPLQTELAKRPHDVTAIPWAETQGLAYALVASNHRGTVAQGDDYLRMLDPLVDQLRGRFERLPLVLDVQVYTAVHRMNAYDFDAAYQDLMRLATNLDGILSLMGDLAQGREADLRSDLLGRVLGTALQADYMAARRDANRYVTARTLSERALSQFEAPEDRARQAGYRMILETDAGNLEEARLWLAQALGLPFEAEPAALAEKAAKFEFYAMYFAHYSAAVARAGDKAQADTLRKAWDDAKVANHPVLQNLRQHPSHVTLWKWGAAQVAMGRKREGLGHLERVISACEEHSGVTLRTIGLGAMADRLACLTDDGDNAVKAGRKAFERTLEYVTGPKQPSSLRTYFEPWKQALAAAPSLPADTWRKFAREIPY